MGKKHILFIVENAPVPLDKRVWSEALAAKEWGYEVSIISPKLKGATRAFEITEGISIYRHPMPFEADGKIAFVFEYLNALFWEILLSVRVFLRKPFDIIHGANPPDDIFVIALLFKILGVKYVFDHHDICPENYLAKFQRPDIFYRLLLFAERLTFATADIVISTNQSYREIALQRGKKNREEVFVVRNGPDLSKIIFMSPNQEYKKGFDYLVAYIGVISSQEGIDALLRAVSYIVFQKNIRNIKFIIIGRGTHWEKMVKLSEDMGLSKYVVFTGFIPYREVYEILATADACVDPEYKNSFTDKSTMLKIMDYMVFGKPIVQFDTKEGRVTAGESSVYVGQNDDVLFAEAIVHLLNDADKRRKLGETGSKRIRNSLNWDEQKKYLKSAYQYLETK